MLNENPNPRRTNALSILVIHIVQLHIIYIVWESQCIMQDVAYDLWNGYSMSNKYGSKQVIPPRSLVEITPSL